jgi:hypothetical protein
MKPEAIGIARSRLRTASRALDALRAAEHKPEEFADHWFVFLTSWKNIYTVLEQGSKSSAQSRQWFGGKKADRKADPLLQYLFEARNDDSYGLTNSVHHTGGGYLMRATKDITQMQVRLNTATGEMEAVGPDGEPVAALIQHTGRGPELRTVDARGDRKIEPPIEHLGQRIDIRPIPVAELALTYAESLVAEAEATCTPSP